MAADKAGAFAFLGNRNATLQTIKSYFPFISFSRVQQVHGDTICETSLGQDLLYSADAHFSYQKNLGLCVITADCAPILLFSPEDKVIAAVHAGWRGVANRILPKTLSTLQKRGVQLKNLKIVVGPHIQLDSFEVESSVKDEILKSIQSPRPHKHYFDISKNKSKIDLHEVLKDQIFEHSIHQDNLFFLKSDTRSDTKYHSYRRDKENSGRQISFIVMEEPEIRTSGSL